MSAVSASCRLSGPGQGRGATRVLRGRSRLPQLVRLVMGCARPWTAGPVPEMRGDGPVIPFSVIWLAIVSGMW